MASFVRATFLQVFHYRPLLATDSRGIASYGEVVEARCRYEPSNKIIRDTRGVATVEEAMLFTEAAVKDEDLVWPPGVPVPADPDDTTGTVPVLVVQTRYLLFGRTVDHYEVHLG